jgi:hypothetical protein
MKVKIKPAFKSGDKLICVDDSSKIKIKKNSLLTVYSVCLNVPSKNEKDGYVRFEGRNTSSYRMSRFTTVSDLRRQKIKKIEKYE